METRQDEQKFIFDAGESLCFTSVLRLQKDSEPEWNLQCTRFSQNMMCSPVCLSSCLLLLRFGSAGIMAGCPCGAAEIFLPASLRIDRVEKVRL